MCRYREELVVAAYLSSLASELLSQIWVRFLVQTLLLVLRARLLGFSASLPVHPRLYQITLLWLLLVVAAAVLVTVLVEEEVVDGQMAEAVLM